MVGNFQTPQNEKSFSGMVDQVILDTGRASSLLSVIQYANATIRECHALGLFAKDLLEETVTVTASPFILTNPLRQRRLRTVKYLNCCEYPRLKLPGRQLQDQKYYYYAADDYFAFAGAAIGETLATARYYWPKSFMYFAYLGASNTPQLPGSGYQTRPAYFDKYSDTWMYLNSANPPVYVTTLGDQAAELLARNNTLNWSLMDWMEMIQEGTKSKIFNLFSDARGPTSFSLYKSQQKDFTSSTAFESEDV